MLDRSAELQVGLRAHFQRHPAARDEVCVTEPRPWLRLPIERKALHVHVLRVAAFDLNLELLPIAHL